MLVSVAKGIPSLVVAAASFDDVVAISGYTIFKSFALSAGHGGVAWTIMHGPVDMIAGVTMGMLAGVIASATAFWQGLVAYIMDTFERVYFPGVFSQRPRFIFLKPV